MAVVAAVESASVISSGASSERNLGVLVLTTLFVTGANAEVGDARNANAKVNDFIMVVLN